MAYFKKADRTSVNIYAADLEKLGSAENAFVDLATILYANSKNEMPHHRGGKYFAHGDQ